MLALRSIRFAAGARAVAFAQAPSAARGAATLADLQAARDQGRRPSREQYEAVLGQLVSSKDSQGVVELLATMSRANFQPSQEQLRAWYKLSLDELREEAAKLVINEEDEDDEFVNEEVLSKVAVLNNKFFMNGGRPDLECALRLKAVYEAAREPGQAEELQGQIDVLQTLPQFFGRASA